MVRVLFELILFIRGYLFGRWFFSLTGGAGITNYPLGSIGSICVKVVEMRRMIEHGRLETIVLRLVSLTIINVQFLVEVTVH